MTRNQALIGITSVAVLVSFGAIGVIKAAEPEPQVIKITAKKFEYQPAEFKIKKGVPVVLELTSADVVMGFNSVDLGVRADVIPGKVARIKFTPTKTGVFAFF